jgi:4-hydroxythreonine-4-phosphate dehydrogenase
MSRVPLAITTGDPGGVGPEVSLRVALSVCATDRVIVFGDADWLAARAIALGAARDSLRQLTELSEVELQPGELGLVDVGVPWDVEARVHRPTAKGGAAQLASLNAAIAAARAGRVRALVTAPISKEAVHLADPRLEFTGHTEHLARAVGLLDDQVSMLFLGPALRVGLVTTHVSIARAPAEITQARVLRTVRHMGEALLRWRRDVRGARADASESARPLVLGVAGLNPHAGEGGLFGDEEQRIVVPAMNAAAEYAPFIDRRVELRGPIPAETAFRIAAAGELDGVVAMLHDQATIASKLLDWGQAVNVTWGLPFVRTSVDHGVAYDAAESGNNIDHAGMSAALKMAQHLTSPH